MDENFAETQQISNLLVAAKDGNIDAVREALYVLPVDSFIKGRGVTALHWAAETGNVPLARLLIERSADVNFQDQTMATPLHKAAWNGMTLVAKLLIVNGADMELRDQDGESPADGSSFSAEVNVETLYLEASIEGVEEKLFVLRSEKASQRAAKRAAELSARSGASTQERQGGASSPAEVREITNKLARAQFEMEQLRRDNAELRREYELHLSMEEQNTHEEITTRFLKEQLSSLEAQGVQLTQESEETEAANDTLESVRDTLSRELVRYIEEVSLPPTLRSREEESEPHSGLEKMRAGSILADETPQREEESLLKERERRPNPNPNPNPIWEVGKRRGGEASWLIKECRRRMQR